MTTKRDYRVIGEPYDVREECPTHPGIVPGDPWWEYRMELLDEDGDVVDEWNSIELDNGMAGQRPGSREDCERVIEDVRAGVAEGRAREWFDPERIDRWEGDTDER